MANNGGGFPWGLAALGVGAWFVLSRPGGFAGLFTPAPAAPAGTYLDPATNTYQPIPATGVPPSAIPQGYYYDPVTRTVQPIPATGVPPGGVASTVTGIVGAGATLYRLYQSLFGSPTPAAAALPSGTAAIPSGPPGANVGAPLDPFNVTPPSTTPDLTGAFLDVPFDVPVSDPFDVGGAFLDVPFDVPVDFDLTGAFLDVPFDLPADLTAGFLDVPFELPAEFFGEGWDALMVGGDAVMLAESGIMSALSGALTGVLGGMIFTSFIDPAIWGVLLHEWFGLGSGNKDPRFAIWDWYSAMNANLGELIGANESFGVNAARLGGIPLSAATTPDELYRVLMGGEYAMLNTGRSPLLGFPGSEYQTAAWSIPELDPVWQRPQSPAFYAWVRDPSMMHVYVRPVSSTVFTPPDLAGFNARLNASIKLQARIINLLSNVAPLAAAAGMTPGAYLAARGTSPALVQTVNDLYAHHDREVIEAAARHAWYVNTLLLAAGENVEPIPYPSYAGTNAQIIMDPVTGDPIWVDSTTLQPIAPPQAFVDLVTQNAIDAAAAYNAMVYGDMAGGPPA